MLSKQCTACRQIKAISEYSPDKRIASGTQSRCKICYAEIMKARRIANPQAHREAVKKHTLNNYSKKIERNNQYRTNNPDKVSIWKRKDRTTNKVRVLADNAMRRTKLAGKLTPEIKQIYALRDFYESMSMGELFHVDHITPIAKGGLHIASNLQVLTATDNLRKGTN